MDYKEYTTPLLLIIAGIVLRVLKYSEGSNQIYKRYWKLFIIMGILSIVLKCYADSF